MKLGVALLLAASVSAQSTLNRRDTGYRGIWYSNQPSDDEYVYKYSGGLGTYCAKHQPFAVYCRDVDKTFFCYGSTSEDDFRRLHHNVSYFDHATSEVPRPVIVLDKRTSDAHDNPVLAVDTKGYLWVFSTSHGRSRPSFVHRSRLPYSIAEFDRVDATYLDSTGEPRPLTNFSYMQAWHRPEGGFACFFTRYGDPVARTNMFMTSDDGEQWSAWRRLAAIEQGHYQISTAERGRLAAVCNYHPAGKGLNWRTNLYYMESTDGGKTWRSAAGTELELPLTGVESPALVHDYAAANLLVYLKDLRIDREGKPVVLYITSPGYRSGPANDPRTWMVARWTGERWTMSPITTSDHNYDMGSLFLDADRWCVVAPTAPGPQRYNPGGEVVMWSSSDHGATWRRDRQLTQGSEFNHTYVRRPVNAHPDFYALWADGDARAPSASRLYFCNRDGSVFRLPVQMDDDSRSPERVHDRK